ncbi:MAG: DUF3987 domain-containing protein [Methylobacter sp.]
MMEIFPQTYGGKRFVHAWEYRAEDGAVFGYAVRYEDAGKKIVVPFFKRSGSNSYVAGNIDHNRPLFGLDKLAKHPKDKAVFILEGEKCVTAAHGLHIIAITSPGGSNAADKADWTPLNGFETAYLLPDNDEPGEHYMRDVVRALLALDKPPEIKILRLPDLDKGGDLVNWLQLWLDEWDSYSAIPETAVNSLRDEIKELLKTAESVPQDWLKSDVGSSDWPEPSTLAVALKPVQELRRELLPAAYAPWLYDVAHRMQSPLDFATVTALVITGSIIGAGCGIRPKQKDDWEVIPNLWGACIGRPSVVLKTPSMKEPLQMLDRLQAEAGKTFEQAKAEYEFNALANKAMLDDVKGQIVGKAKGKGKDRVVDSTDMAKLKADILNWPRIPNRNP